jgi:hypothetical protein
LIDSNLFFKCYGNELLSTYGSGENNILLGNSADMGANSFPLSIAAPAELVYGLLV